MFMPYFGGLAKTSSLCQDLGKILKCWKLMEKFYVFRSAEIV